MTSSRPYLLRALYSWILDNGLTPFVVVDAEMPGVDVPPQAVQNGQVVFNLNPSAVKQLNIGDDYLSFSARFSGTAREVFVPILAVLAIYSRENGQGMVFGAEPGSQDGADQSEEKRTGPVSVDARPEETGAAAPNREAPESDHTPSGDDRPRAGKRRGLRVVK